MARLYANENFPFPVVVELRHRGHDVLTMQEAGQANQSLSDESVLSFARIEGRVLLSLNRKHFIKLHRTQQNHAGIIVCSFNPDFVEMAQQIHAILETTPQLSGQLFRINRPARE
jgi:hypothetical protein